MKKEEKGKKRKNILDKFSELNIKLLKKLCKLLEYLIVGLVFGILTTLEQMFDLLSSLFNKLPKFAKMIAIYLIIGIITALLVFPQKVINYVGFEKIVEQEKVVYVNYEESKCRLDEMSCKIYFIAKQYGLTKKQSLIAVAISKVETGNYKYLGYNNFGGNMGSNGKLKHFDTQEEGINYFVSNLKYGYFDLGLTTIKDIQPKYCPVGATNDPNGLNVNWLNNVSNNYEVLYGRI